MGNIGWTVLAQPQDGHNVLNGHYIQISTFFVGNPAIITHLTTVGAASLVVQIQQELNFMAVSNFYAKCGEKT